MECRKTALLALLKNKLKTLFFFIYFVTSTVNPSGHLRLKEFLHFRFGIGGGKTFTTTGLLSPATRMDLSVSPNEYLQDYFPVGITIGEASLVA